ncbi:hypothetical protein [Phenylobacterium sp.]|uniref:hypothetical protein n=1 Tax=Phenylobacterium sp. TaxID=1871053 RepID=UPI002F3E5E74
MGPFEYLLAFIAVILGLAVSDLAISLHRLLSAGARVRWDALAPLAAIVAFLKILTQWWSWFGTAQIARGLTFEMFLGIVSATVMMFLLAAAALPDETPHGGPIDLAAHFQAVRRRFWLLFAGETVLMTAVDIWAQVAVAHRRFDPLTLASPVSVLIVLSVILAFVKTRWIQGVALLLLIGLYLANSAGRPLAG